MVSRGGRNSGLNCPRNDTVKQLVDEPEKRDETRRNISSHCNRFQYSCCLNTSSKVLVSATALSPQGFFICLKIGKKLNFNLISFPLPRPPRTARFNFQSRLFYSRPIFHPKDDSPRFPQPHLAFHLRLSSAAV